MKIKSFLWFPIVALVLFAQIGWAGFSVSGTKLLDANGQRFVMRGVNHAHTWYRNELSTSLEDIASTGANTVRVVLSNGDRWTKDSSSSVANIIGGCKANQLICMLEVHDSTGYPEQSGSTHLSNAVDYWIEIGDVLKGEEDYILINIANEPFGNTGVAANDWKDSHIAAITRLRNDGFTHTLVVDGPNWGQDHNDTMYNDATAVFAADSLSNTIFSVHMYQVYATKERIEDYIGGFLAHNSIPLIVGEFGADHQGANVDEDTIFAYTEEKGVGYLGWSWSGNGDCCVSLDIVEGFDVSRLSVWGERLVNGANGIKATSVLASVFDGVSSISSQSSSSSSLSSSSSSSSAAGDSGGGGSVGWLMLLILVGSRQLKKLVR
ncbi:glycoside hydrolase family 5 protein [Teredinibacter haidensis]|uniref:glycoside hydrolase family 5 protein n=1 Tax=Teredinibacter haidensis TaxID=2731755 RepID=UPI000948DCB7|nr:glycoside hydrolase family 5 protein [Teredinibacter haidensis]